MCGSNRKLVRAKIEGTVLDVCQGCARFGEIVKVPRPVTLNPHKRHVIHKNLPEKIEVIVLNYYSLIKSAREKRGLKQEDVARKMSEKESLYHRIESGQVKPSIRMAKKLEEFFKIKLVEEHSDKMQATMASAPINKNAMTIADIIRKK